MTDPATIAESMDDDSILDETRKRRKLGELPKKPKYKEPAPERTITSVAQLRFWRRIARGLYNKASIDPPFGGPKGHSVASWAKTRRYLQHQNPQLAAKDDADLVITARKILAKARIPKTKPGMEGGLDPYAPNRRAQRKREKRHAASTPTARPIREALNEYMPVNDDFMDRLNKALSDE